MSFSEDLKARGYGEHTSSPLEEILEHKRSIYHGVDPTADSLHVGHLVPILLMKRLMDQGHRGIFLVGGGTGMIGDPRESGERQLLDRRTLEHNKRGIRKQLQKIVGKRIEMVDNLSWLKKVSLIEFLRDIGKHFTVNELVKRDLIKRRLTTAEESISFTEFTYSLLQGYDFLTLFKKKGVTLQVGGSDQWTNMLSGVELIRRKEGGEAYCFTAPLITDAAGKKFGKSEGNAVWLDPQKTSPFRFYQFWVNLPDERVEEYLKVYTLMSLTEIDALLEMHGRNKAERKAQHTLALHITELVHGKAAAEQAQAATQALFGGTSLAELKNDEKAVLLSEVETVRISSKQLDEGYGVVDALVEGKLAGSKSDAKRLLQGKGVSLNGSVVDEETKLTQENFSGGLGLLKKGKRDAVVLVLK